jgi:hypothetical protein
MTLPSRNVFFSLAFPAPLGINRKSFEVHSKTFPVKLLLTADPFPVKN